MSNISKDCLFHSKRMSMKAYCVDEQSFRMIGQGTTGTAYLIYFQIIKNALGSPSF